MIVVDTNVIGYLYLSSPRSGQAAAALRRDPDWAAPRIWRSELCKVLAIYVRGEHLSLPEASNAMSTALALLAGAEYDVAPTQVLALAAESGCSAYDCEFAALARELDVSLVTVDRQLLAAFPGTAVSLEDFARTSA